MNKRDFVKAGLAGLAGIGLATTARASEYEFHHRISGLKAQTNAGCAPISGIPAGSLTGGWIPAVPILPDNIIWVSQDPGYLYCLCSGNNDRLFVIEKASMRLLEGTPKVPVGSAQLEKVEVTGRYVVVMGRYVTIVYNKTTWQEEPTALRNTGWGYMSQKKTVLLGNTIVQGHGGGVRGYDLFSGEIVGEVSGLRAGGTSNVAYDGQYLYRCFYGGIDVIDPVSWTLVQTLSDLKDAATGYSVAPQEVLTDSEHIYLGHDPSSSGRSNVTVLDKPMTFEQGVPVYVRSVNLSGQYFGGMTQDQSYLYHIPRSGNIRAVSKTDLMTIIAMPLMTLSGSLNSQLICDDNAIYAPVRQAHSGASPIGYIRKV